MRSGARYRHAAKTGEGIVSLPRALSKLGYCSRASAEGLIRTGRVKVNGRVVLNTTERVDLRRDSFAVDDVRVRPASLVYLMLNKPRGLITSASDDQGRDTVFKCFEGAGLPRLVPVGRLDQASEGLLLFTNDTTWANRITAPESHLSKLYHVQVRPIPAGEDLERCLQGVRTDGGDLLKCSAISQIRTGERNAWLEIVLHEGRNRHIRRMLATLDIEVLRLIRVAIGPLKLGNLAKGHFRLLSEQELRALSNGRPEGV
jgi:23S rRNA pseudouridine2605 synthase